MIALLLGVELIDELYSGVPSVASADIQASLSVGAFAAPMYPIASAQAYAALPGRSGTVNAAGQIFAPLTLAAPWLLGALADRWGLTAALALLLLQPIGLIVVALWSCRR